MSLLYSNNFKFSDGELKKSLDYNIDTNFNHLNSSSSFASIIHGSDGDNNREGGGGGCEEYRYVRSSSPEVETILTRFMSSCNGGEDSGSQRQRDVEDGLVKQENVEPVQHQNGYCNRSLYQNQEVHALQNRNTVNFTALESSFGVMSSLGFENSMQPKISRNCSNLARQSSCPAEFLSNLSYDNGFATARDLRSFGTGNGISREADPSVTRITGQINFSSGLASSSRNMPHISEQGNENMGIGSLEDHNLRNASNQNFIGNFPNNPWDDSAFRSLKRAKDNNGNVFYTTNAMEAKNPESRTSIHGLTHHLSLPKTFSEMATTEKFLQFQDLVPFKARAKRGCATHPRSIAERVRRSRISERMRKLQEVFPNMDKQTSQADMLDLAVEYIKGLQRQVEALADTKANCTCSSKHKEENSNPCS